MQNPIFSKVLGQIFRYALTILASYLAFVGVDKETYGELVAVLINILVPLVLALAVQFWAIAQKRWETFMTEYARNSPEGTSLREVAAAVAENETVVAPY